MKFTMPGDDAGRKEELKAVYAALRERGYDPVNQIVGYLLTEDPTYITNFNNARARMSRMDRDELLRDMIVSYLSDVHEA